MIHLDGVTDRPKAFGSRKTLLSAIDFTLPKGRYGLVSLTPQYHRALIDIIAGTRPPRWGKVRHEALVSWPLGRPAPFRGKASGYQMINFICAMYGLNPSICTTFVSELISHPDELIKPMEHWPLYLRTEFNYAIGLAPPFDVYVVEGSLPFESNRFSRLWQALFAERIVGRTLILSTNRKNQILEYCAKALVYENESFRIDDDLEKCVERYDARQSLGGDADDYVGPGGGGDFGGGSVSF